ncbi:hypothetical protein OTERR_01340 [Oryzomicrobium terrae]|uniref:PNPLA domain-containing protein n=1 Tax=Oryzomicrobium terrae TaxID=1735038 RepID=A0A5C1E427_9RHOO|nr:patatin-like phospholipase family protein [Oryzomicrobium terrae]QEL63610.1 hypothetical protein OTERR_01340 [Oryzomicrobium terrae]
MASEIVTQDAYPQELTAGRPLAPPAPPEGTFEIGLVLAGAVSAGAYTAGVLDFLFEALEAWQDAKAAGRDVPRHEVRIRVITGASAGAISGAIAATALRYRFPHCTAKKLDPTNPLFKAWVEDIDITKLLETGDLTRNALPQSLLDASCLTRIAADAISYSNAPLADRPYVADPLKLIFTVTNLCGVPYSIAMKGNSANGHEMTMHADWLRFAVAYSSDARDSPSICPDETLLAYPNSWNVQVWQDLGTAALASAAFPIGLLPRLFTRKTSDYDYRYVMVPGEGGQPPGFIQIKPTWKNPPPSPTYTFLNVDGGVMNNEPLDLARKELAGELGHNPRDGLTATRAIIMVDPFPDPAQLGPDAPVDLVRAGLGLTTAWKEQARFKPEDVALALAPNVFSRFLVSPSRGQDSAISKGYALASGALGGFSGFLHRSYRLHDYLLGRRNCQQFLARHFSLPADNPLFAGRMPTDRSPYLIGSGTAAELPLIPLMPGINDPGANQEAVPAWPVGQFNVESIRSPMSERVGAVLSALKDAKLSGGFKFGIGCLLWAFQVRRKITDWALHRIDQELGNRGL